MDVYDFDGTLYEGDSTADFLAFCVRRHPSLVRFLPRTGLTAFACLGLRLVDKTRFKSVLYRFLAHLPDVEREVREFWRANEHKVHGPCQPKPGDLIISAGPEFLLRSVCESRGWKLIASQVDPHTGRVLGPNCSGPEKVARFRARFPDQEVMCFFSDSRNDDPMAELAHDARMVNIPKQSVEPWPA